MRCFFSNFDAMSENYQSNLIPQRGTFGSLGLQIGSVDAEYFLMNALPFPVHLLRGCPEDAENIFSHRKGHLSFARKHFISAGAAHDSGFS